jgi:Yip1 domain
MDSQDSTSPHPSPAPQEKVSVWEDFLDIFYAPTQVFRRRAAGNFWIPLLVATLLMAILAFANRNVMEPIYNAEFARNASKMMQANPNLTPELLERSKAIGFAATLYGGIVLVPILALIVAFTAWLLAKLFGAKLSWNAAMIAASFWLIPRVVQQVGLSIQGLLLDPASLVSRFSVEVGPGRFMDPATINPVVGVLYDHLDLFVLWSAVVITIGVATMGKLPKAKAWAFGLTFWVVTMLPGLLGALKAM